jgi:AraC family transcriptional regulator
MSLHFHVATMGWREWDQGLGLFGVRPVPSAKAFRVDETHKVTLLPGARIRASSDGRPWSSLFASLQWEEPFEGQFDPVNDIFLCLNLSGPARLSGVLGGRRDRRVIPVGGVFLLPQQVKLDVALEAPVETLHLYVRSSIFEEIAADMVAGDPALHIVPRFGVVDPLLEQLGMELRDLLVSGETCPIYADCIARAIAARLVRGHSTASVQRAVGQKTEGLGTRQLECAIDFIEGNLACTFGLAEIAAAANLGPQHFSRQFKRRMGIPPHRFVMRTRVERAKRMLVDTDLPVKVIAFSCGFSHQEHLTRLFRSQIGTTPAAYRRISRS